MADLTITITEAVALEGETRGSTNALVISGINHTMERIVTCDASNTTTLAVFNTNAYGADGAIDTDNTRYIRVTNLDNTNAIELAFVSASTLYQVELEAGQTHVLGSATTLLLGEEDITPSFGVMEDLVSIKANPGVNSVKIEMFIAGI